MLFCFLYIRLSILDILTRYLKKFFSLTILETPFQVMLEKILPATLDSNLNIKLPNLKVLAPLVILIITVNIYKYGDSYSSFISSFIYKSPIFVFQSTCECKKWEKIVIEENSTDYSGKNQQKLEILRI